LYKALGLFTQAHLMVKTRPEPRLFEKMAKSGGIFPDQTLTKVVWVRKILTRLVASLGSVVNVNFTGPNG
jgi:hypothetical protein